MYYHVVKFKKQCNNCFYSEYCLEKDNKIYHTKNKCCLKSLRNARRLVFISNFRDNRNNIIEVINEKV